MSSTFLIRKRSPKCNRSRDESSRFRSRIKRVPRGIVKMKKVQPEHSHGIGELCGVCRLCETHGDVVLGDMGEVRYSEVQSHSMELGH